MSFVIDESDDENDFIDNTTRIRVSHTGQSAQPTKTMKSNLSMYVADATQLERFLNLVYEYYVCNGLANFIIQKLVSIGKLAFIAALFYFVSACVQYDRLFADLRQNTTLSTAQDKLTGPIVLPMIHFGDYIVSGDLPWFTWPFFTVFAVYFVLLVFNSARSVKEMFAVRDFYEFQLKIKKNVQQRSWPQIVSLVAQSRDLERVGLHIGDQFDIVTRITRLQNYIVALVALDVLSAGPDQQSILLRKENVLMCTQASAQSTHVRPLMTKTLHWALERTLFALVFSGSQLSPELASFLPESNNLVQSDGSRSEPDKKWLFENADSPPIDREQMANMQHSHLLPNQSAWFALVGSLATRFRFLAILGLLLAPFVFCFLIVDFVLEHGERWQRQPQNIFSAQQWSNDAQWRLRQYNQVDHFFQEQLAFAAPLANKYINSFPAARGNAVLQFISYCIGSVFLTLVLLGIVFDDDFFTRVALAANRSALWWLTLLGATLAVLRSLDTSTLSNEREKIVCKPQQHFQELQEYLQYCPERWQNNGCANKSVKQEFNFLYERRWIGWLRELTGILYTPYLLWFFLPQKAERLLRFFVQSTVAVESQHYCRFALEAPYPFDDADDVQVSRDCESDTTLHIQKMTLSRRNFAKYYQTNTVSYAAATGLPGQLPV